MVSKRGTTVRMQIALFRFQCVIPKPHKGIGKTPFYFSFSCGQVFKYLLSSHVQLKACCLAAHCPGGQYPFWQLKSSAFERCAVLSRKPMEERMRKPLRFLFIWDRDHIPHKNRFAVAVKEPSAVNERGNYTSLPHRELSFSNHYQQILQVIGNSDLSP